MRCLKFFSLIFAIFSLSAFANETHVIEKGDTLFSLSRKYGVTVDQICEANNMTRETTIKLGQKLVIPTEKKEVATTPKDSAQKADETQTSTKEETPKLETTTYTVAKGDTWYGISRKNGISVPQLWAMNNVDSTAELKAGQKIKIPMTQTVASTEVKKTSDSATDTTKKTGEAEKPTSIASISDPKSYTKTGDPKLVWPVNATSVNYIDGKVSGVKLVTSKNEAVKSIASGNVMFSGSYRGFGNVVFIQSKTSHIYAYTGLGKISVEKGDYIVSGSEIGKAGVDSYSKQNSVSLMVFQNGLPIDPAKAPRG